MQNGSIMRSTRLRGPDVWEFRWREAGADGKRKHRRMVIGSTAQFSDKSSALLSGEVELWLRSLPLARASCAKIRNLMSVVFNHAIRHQVYSRNPIRLVRQSAKRRKIPVVLSASEVQQLLDALALRATRC